MLIRQLDAHGDLWIVFVMWISRFCLMTLVKNDKCYMSGSIRLIEIILYTCMDYRRQIVVISIQLTENIG